MKNKKVTNPKTIDKINSIINHHERMKGSYFWNSPSNASSKRSYEKQNSLTTEFTFNKNKYKIVQNVQCSCNNIYYSIRMFENEKILNKDIRFLKGLIKE